VDVEKSGYPQNEERLLHLAYQATASQVERVARAWRRCDRLEEAPDRYRQLARSATTYVDDDGMVVLRARLPPEQGAVVQCALEAAAERLYQDNKSAAAPESLQEEVSFAQRRADALSLMVEVVRDRSAFPRKRRGAWRATPASW